MRRWRFIVVGVAIACLRGAAAQAQFRSQGEASRPHGGGAAGQQLPAQAGDANRARLERQFQQMLYQMTRRRVGLTDAQMNRLVPVNRRFEVERRGIQREERETRIALRDALRDSSNTDQSRISGYLDKLVQLQRRRVDLVDAEQRELAQFMTPAQRARYTALQEQLRNRIDQMRRRNRSGSKPNAGGARPSP